MKHPERIHSYLDHIVQAIERITSYVRDIPDVSRFLERQETQDAVVRNIEIIGEAANKIQKAAPEFLLDHPELPWAAMRTMRNKMVHDYFDVDAGIVWNTIEADLPRLKQQVLDLLFQIRSRQ